MTDNDQDYFNTRRACPVERLDVEDEDQRQNQDHDGVDLQAGRLVGVEPQHCAGAATGACRSRAAGTSIGDLLLLVGGGSSSDGSSRTARGRRRGWTTGAGTRAGRVDGGRRSRGGLHELMSVRGIRSRVTHCTYHGDVV